MFTASKKRASKKIVIGNNKKLSANSSKFLEKKKFVCPAGQYNANEKAAISKKIVSVLQICLLQYILRYFLLHSCLNLEYLDQNLNNLLLI